MNSLNKIKQKYIDNGLNPTENFYNNSIIINESAILLNPAKATNFIYEIIGENLTIDKIEEINNIQTKTKIRDRLSKLYELGFALKYNSMENQVFQANLTVIDSLLPDIIAQMLIYFYKDGISNLTKLLNELESLNPCSFNNEYQHPFYKYKIKNFMTDIALGMTSAKTWLGKYDATGGYIIVREDGEVLCYHMYNRNEFQDYLLKNTKFETASSTRHKFGTIYKEHNKYFIKLNLQIRFI